MKIDFLGPRSSIHLVRWANELQSRGHSIHVLTMHGGGEPLYNGVKVMLLPFAAPHGYFVNAPFVRAILRKDAPDLLQAHYATGYGNLSRLSRFHPIALHVWGSDVFQFPLRSRFNANLLQANLRAADLLTSTSHVMAEQAIRFAGNDKRVEVVPFGIDCEKFRPSRRSESKRLRFGTFKALAPIYGIDDLINAFAMAVRQGMPPAELIIGGSGTQSVLLKTLAASLQIESLVRFVGAVRYARVPAMLASLDVYVALSRMESFGVGALEASACALPVIATDVGGLPEVVEEAVTGFLVSAGDIEAAAARMVELGTNPALRKRMGHNGRQMVLRRYQWKESVDRMELLYRELVRCPVNNFRKTACHPERSESASGIEGSRTRVLRDAPVVVERTITAAMKGIQSRVG